MIFGNPLKLLELQNHYTLTIDTEFMMQFYKEVLPFVCRA